MRDDLPRGTVTFLFTDIEGSTRLLLELGDAYGEALASHRRALRDAFARHGGVEVDTQGDAFFVAFVRAPDAVAAAAEAQEALRGSRVRVRMGLHTGEPTVTDEGYVGLDVHRGARIAAAGHGGQVLLSGETRRELADTGISLRDLGLHRLKDLGEPVRIYQVGEEDYPPLATLEHTNLPVQTTPFVGRERELGEVLALLLGPGLRLLTLTGAGGSGKTRLALQAAAETAHDFAYGVTFVGLAPIREPQLVLETVAAELGAAGDLARHIADKSLLLLLDNFEQVVEAAAGVAELLRTCPNLRVLVTSREPLHVTGEQEYPVPPFVEEEGVGFFTARARAVRPGFEPDQSVREICRRLDELPLALELAAARVKALSPGQILARLERRLPLLTGGPQDAPERQRTLAATIAWSHDLLAEAEQLLFRRLAVFAGGWTLEAAESICDADVDTLRSLVDKSLVGFEGQRYSMLETIREYASERLEETGAGVVRRRHAEFFLALARSANLSIEAEAPARHELVLPEADNLRAALAWALDADPVTGLELAVALENFWVTQNPLEGMRWFEALLDRAGGVPSDLQARALRDFGGSADIAGELEQAERLYREGLATYRSLGDERGVANLVHRLGVVASKSGDSERARPLWEESLAIFRRLGDRKGEAQPLQALANLEYEEGRPEQAVELAERSLELSRETGFVWIEAWTLTNLAEYALALGRVDQAKRQATQALELGMRMEDRQTMFFGLALLAQVAARTGDVAGAGRLWGALQTEEGRARVGAEWEAWRDSYAGPVLAHAGPELDEGLAAGRRLSLDEAARSALGGGGTLPPEGSDEQEVPAS
jgi:predicted ATPase/class 3 adenylate cyclase